MAYREKQFGPRPLAAWNHSTRCQSLSILSRIMIHEFYVYHSVRIDILAYSSDNHTQYTIFCDDNGRSGKNCKFRRLADKRLAIEPDSLSSYRWICCYCLIDIHIHHLSSSLRWSKALNSSRGSFCPELGAILRQTDVPSISWKHLDFMEPQNQEPLVDFLLKYYTDQFSQRSH